MATAAVVVAAALLGHPRRAKAATNWVWTGAFGDATWTTAGSASNSSNWIRLDTVATNQSPGSAGDVTIADAVFDYNASANNFAISLPAAIAIPTNVSVGSLEFGNAIANKGIYTLASNVSVGSAATTITLTSSAGLSRLLAGTDNQPSGQHNGATYSATGGLQTIVSKLAVLSTAGNQTWAIGGSGELQLSGTITTPSNVSITKSKGGQLEIDADNSLTLLGGYVAQGGTTLLGNANALGTGLIQVSGTGAGVTANASLLTGSGITFPNAVNVANNPNGVTVTLGGAPTQTSSTWTGGITLAQAVTLTGGAGLTTFGGAITGTGNVTKVDAGTVVLTGQNSYVGNTNVSAGTLLVNGAGTTGAGDVVVNGTSGTAFGTLGGTATAGNTSTGAGAAPGTGVVIINGYGTLTAGNGSSYAGTQTTGAELWNSSNGSYLAKVFDASNTSPGTTPNSGNDRLVLSALTITPGFTVNVSSGTVSSLAPGTVLVLATDTDTVGPNPFNTSGGQAPAGLQLGVNGSPTSSLQLGTQPDPANNAWFDLVLEGTTAAPEPASLLLAGLAATPLMLGRRRR